MTPPTPTDTTQVWDYLPSEGETPAMFAAFAAYRDGPRPRNIGKLADSLGLTRDTVYQYSTKMCWAGRVDEYDKHLDQVAQQATETEVAAHARTALRTCGIALLVAEEALKQLLADVLAKQSSITASQASMLMHRAIILTRLIHGEATERVATAQTDLTRLSDEEFAAFELLQQKATGTEA